MGREIITEDDVRKAEAEAEEAETKTEEARRAGTSKLHGRPLDADGNIQFIAPSVESKIWVPSSKLSFLACAILLAATIALGYMIGRSSPPAVVAHWIEQDHREPDSPDFGTLNGTTGLNGPNTFCLYTFSVSSQLIGTPVTLTDNKGEMIGQFVMAPANPNQDPATITLVKFELHK